MIKITYLIFGREDLAADDIKRLWMIEHGAMVQRLAPRIRLARYVQTIRTPHPLENVMARSRNLNADLPFGMAELSWETLEDLEFSFRDDQAINAYREMLEDEKRFASRSVASTPWIGVEREVINKGANNAAA